ncbi:MAG: MerR family transcriptional regulator [Eubacteriales bacterium]|nr:MerR family transcriptional regulator [Eubacteriales bacterium]
MNSDNNSLASERKENNVNRWQIGEMANYFGISIQTLRYYDEIGLFKPQYRDSDSGYRYYSYKQIYPLANIVFLRKQGYSLNEIKDFLKNVSMEGRLRNLRDQASQLDRDVIRLQSNSTALKNKIDFIESSDYKAKLNLIELVEMPTRDYVDIGSEQRLFPSELFYYFPTVVHYTPLKIEFGAYIMDKPSFLSFISFSPSVEEIIGQIRKIPAGKAYRSFYQGEYENINDKIILMRKYAERDGSEVSSVSVHYNIIDQFVAKNADEYITEIYLPVVKEQLD